jgi:hypothetical protein
VGIEKNMKYKCIINTKKEDVKPANNRKLLYYSHSEVGSVQLGFINHFPFAI